MSTCIWHSGRDNADALFCLPCQQCSRDSHATFAPAVIVITTLQLPQVLPQVRDAWLANTLLGSILRSKEGGTKPSAEQLGRVSHFSHHLLQLWNQLMVHIGVHCLRLKAPDGVCQIVVTVALWEEVLFDLHKGAPWEDTWGPTRHLPS